MFKSIEQVKVKFVFVTHFYLRNYKTCKVYSLAKHESEILIENL